MYTKTHTSYCYDAFRCPLDTDVKKPRPTVNSSRRIRCYEHLLTVSYKMLAKHRGTALNIIKVPSVMCIYWSS